MRICRVQSARTCSRLEGASIAMRTRSRKKSRSSIPLDLHKVYCEGLGISVAQPFEVDLPSDLDFEMEFFQKILVRAPEHVEALSNLGEVYSRRGEYAKGLATDLRLSRIRPDSERVHYNLACSYALNSQQDLALQSLSRAVELGYRDLDHLRNDRDLEVLKTDPRFQTLVQKVADRQHQTQQR